MRKLLLMLFLLCGITCFSQEKTLLYSIKGDGIKTSYLFGTAHLLPDSAFYFPAKLEKTVTKTEQLVLEIDNLSDRSRAQKLMLLDSGSLFDIFPMEQADSVVLWGASLLKMQPEIFKKSFSGMKPFVLMQIAAQAMLVGNSKSYEFELMSVANSNQIPIKGLETMEYQVGLFDNMPDSVIADMIMEGIRHPEQSVLEQQKLVRLYMAKDMEGLAQLIVDSESIASNTERLVFQRNRNWVPVMGAYMKTKSCFFAVGAGHLGGEKGVIQLLKNAGYTVTPITY